MYISISIVGTSNVNDNYCMYVYIYQSVSWVHLTSMITTVCMYISISIVGTSNINDNYCMYVYINQYRGYI